MNTHGSFDDTSSPAQRGAGGSAPGQVPGRVAAGAAPWKPTGGRVSDATSELEEAQADQAGDSSLQGAPGSFRSRDPQRVTFRVDYLALTFHRWLPDGVFRAMTAWFGEGWDEDRWEVSKTSDGSRMVAKGPHGAHLQWRQVEGWTHVSLKGQACGVIGTETILEFCRTVGVGSSEDVRPSRVDVAWDDHERRVLPIDVRDHFWDRDEDRKRDDVVCKAVSGVFHEDDGGRRGSSYRIGAATSDRMLRVYDKAAESMGRIDAIRWELVTRNKVARRLLNDLCGAEMPSEASVRHLVGFLDFRDPESYASHVERRERRDWWERLVGDAIRARCAEPEELDVERWMEHVKRQVGSSVAVFVALNRGDLGEAAAELYPAVPLKPKHQELIKRGVKLRESERRAKAAQESRDR